MLPINDFLVFGTLAAVFAITILFILGSRYRKVGPNEALVISGGRRGFSPKPLTTRRAAPENCSLPARSCRTLLPAST